MAGLPPRRMRELPVLNISKTECSQQIPAISTEERPRTRNVPENESIILKPLTDFKEDEHISCPYNKAHQILISRMQTHLTKCREVHI
jgi:hypothetical protein